MAPYALSIFLGAFLLFQVQPIIGKVILPWFGGAPSVWTTCLLFFQLVLLGGYTYAHLSSRFLKPRTQAITHCLLLAAALLCLPVMPGENWKPHHTASPAAHIFLLLTANVGLCGVALSATGPLLQLWFSRTHRGTAPYRLYALSNAGSLLALLSYPFYIETHLTRHAQATLWSAGLAAFVLSSGYCALRQWPVVSDDPAVGPASDPSDAAGDSLTPARIFLWLALPACASMLLLAVTNKLCQDVAVIPFLWVVPLASYLLSFVICFDHPRWYRRVPMAFLLLAAMGAATRALFASREISVRWQIVIYCGALFVASLVCHGELYRLRPPARRLTGFYLCIATGGVLGGVLVNIAAPLLFADYYELQWAIVVCLVLFTLACARDASPQAQREWRWLAAGLTLAGMIALDQLLVWLGRQYPNVPRGGMAGLRGCVWALFALWALAWVARRRFRTFGRWRLVACCWLSLACAVFGTALWFQANQSRADAVIRSRNFYGVLAVLEMRADEPEAHHFLLRHGGVTHGLQFAGDERARLATTYYGERSGVGLALNALAPGARSVGVVGLGTGTLAAYAAAGDRWRIYEINPAVAGLANSRFRYLAQSRAPIEVVAGDGRLSLEREPAQHFDLLILDAFSSDSIPVHLLTQEAFEVYDRHLNARGVIAVHISNHYIDLDPVVRNLARHFRYRVVSVEYEETDAEWWEYSSTWLLLSRAGGLLDLPAIRGAAGEPATNAASIPLWTDDFTAVYQVLKQAGREAD